MNSLVKADARDRSWRTLLQGMYLDVAIVLLPLLYDAISKWDGSFSAAYWQVVGVALLKTAGMAALAYWMRLKKAPAAIGAPRGFEE